MERQKHHQEKYGNGPNQQHYKEGSYNKHAGNHRYSEEKGGQQMKHDHEYHVKSEREENSNKFLGTVE